MKKAFPIALMFLGLVFIVAGGYTVLRASTPRIRSTTSWSRRTS